MRSVMRNATVTALIYEFLFDVYRLIEAEGKRNLLPDENGTIREAFFHHFTSCWEWSTGVLEAVAAIKTVKPLPPAVLAPNMRSPYSYPLMTLEECRIADFSKFETFDNYCYAMFVLWQLIGQMSGHDELVNLAVLSPRFLEAVATKDDVFVLEGVYRVKINEDRFQKKVMRRWREMDVRKFEPRDDA